MLFSALKPSLRDPFALSSCSLPCFVPPYGRHADILTVLQVPLLLFFRCPGIAVDPDPPYPLR